MKHLKTFESFAINEEEEILGAIFGKSDEKKQEMIKKYTQEILSGNISGDFKKEFDGFVKAKPSQGLGSAMSSWMSNVYNLKQLMENPSKPEGQLEDNLGKMRPAAEVIEQEVAKVILKDRMVEKVDGKWQVVTKGRQFSSTQRTFGSGSGTE